MIDAFILADLRNCNRRRVRPEYDHVSGSREGVTMTDQRKPKIATDLPTPPPLTDEAYAEIRRIGREAREAYLARTAPMEQLGPNELKIRVK
jgi:hypothetical protein